MSENISANEGGKTNFIKEIIKEDLRTAKHDTIATRFPPEPNGYLHIGHAKSICLNFGIAKEFNGTCNLRFDDTNPSKEETEYVDSIQADVKWLGFNWAALYYASDYYEQLYNFALTLIQKGRAFVCDLTAEQMREYRGTLKTPGKESPYRNRSVEENLDLFTRMRKGDFKDGEKTLRAKIDMSSGYIVLRDPVLYRIQRAIHHRTGDTWCIYPMYDFAHPLSDSIEGITHSICTLEFENNRPLYDWVVNETDTPHKPRQIEFARLNLSYTVMSKRKLLELVTKNYVNGWDDPRMPTIAGLRRRGYTPESIRDFAERIGVAKADNMVDIAMLEHCLREDLNRRAQRVMAVLDPVKVIIDNYPEGEVEYAEAVNNPEDEGMGKREMPFSREIFIERSDFMEEPPKGYFRLAPGREVRFKHAYYIKCESFIKDQEGNVTEIHCTYDPETRGGWSECGRKVKGTIHWVSAQHAVECQARLYERLFTKENPDELAEGEDYKANLNPDSLKVTPALVEPFIQNAVPGDRFQFERTGYFCMDQDSKDGKPVFNRTVSLKDSWSRAAARKG